jgi:hypothetical protein
MGSAYLPWYILAMSVVYLLGVWSLLALLQRGLSRGKVQ